jgi:type I restriction enzyme M protein
MSQMPHMQLTEHLSQQQLESYLWGAATLLRGTLDAGDYKQLIFPLLFYKRVCDVYDEEVALARLESDSDDAYVRLTEHRFRIPDGAHWRDVRERSRHIGKALSDAMQAISEANSERLQGIFGDAKWTNKDRLPDKTLRDLMDHFSQHTLSIANVPEDELGVAYEYLIKKFADDSGHTAAEFYTNRTLVRLMTSMLDPKPGESVYDPTCGSGGMLLSCVAQLRRSRKEYRTLKLFGQERNLMTSAIARMNLFLHGIEDFKIARGDTLAAPMLLEDDHLQQFDVILANPPYSIKQWNREAWVGGVGNYGRNILGVPPQGRADYAFFQHILASLKPQTGRCAILFPHGVLFRDEERHMRSKLIEQDWVECVLGLGPNLFYNSPMEACVIVCRSQKPRARRGQVLFINAVNEVTRERSQSFLEQDHIETICQAYGKFTDIDGFARVVPIAEIQANHGNLNIAQYVRVIARAGEDASSGSPAATGLRESVGPAHATGLCVAIQDWQASRQTLRLDLSPLLKALRKTAD